MSEVRLAVEQRQEFGKGAARRTRRAGKIPAVLYGHGAEPRHLSLPAIEFARVIRENGRNSVITLEVDGDGKQLALTKTIVVHPLKNYIEHVDLLVLQKGEKVTVDIPLTIIGEAVRGSLVNQDLDVISVEVDALHIPDHFEISIEDAEIGFHITAGGIDLPQGVELLTDPEALVLAVNEAPSEEALEAELDAEVAEIPEAEGEEAAEETEGEAGESAEAAAEESGE